MRKILALVAVPALAVSATPALATTPAALDFTTLTDAIDVATVTAAIMAAGGLIILVSLAVMGVRKVKSMIR
jgi:hypothetical protein